jgi:LysM repeat protein
VLRCPDCGSRLPPGARDCAICGQRVPRRLTFPGIALESLAAVLIVAVVAAGLLWLRHRGGPGIATPERDTVTLIGRMPTAVPTATPAPTRTATRPPNTPRPPTPTPLPEVIVYTVQSGDTLYGIAATYGVTGDAILAANAEVLDSPHRLSIGQELRIPLSVAAAHEALAPDGEEVSEGAAEPAREAAGEPSGSPAEDRVAEGPAVQVPDLGAEETTVYSVQPGDTITEVAQTHGLQSEELVRLNAEALNGVTDTLRLGEMLVVRPAEVMTASRAADPSLVLGPGAALDSGLAVLPPDELVDVAYPAPIPLMPGDGVTVTASALLLRWSSAGPLPPGMYYAVALRDAAVPDAQDHLEWVAPNATALRVPADFRPSLGNVREIAWSVSVRRRVDRLIGRDTGVLLSPAPEWRTFTWAPGRD